LEIQFFFEVIFVCVCVLGFDWIQANCRFGIFN